jgi:hypothetical protein
VHGCRHWNSPNVDNGTPRSAFGGYSVCIWARGSSICIWGFQCLHLGVPISAPGGSNICIWRFHRLLASALSVHSMAGRTMEILATVSRFPTPRGRFLGRQRSRSGHPWRSTGASVCGTMQKGETPAGSLKSLRRSRVGVGHTMALPHITSMPISRLVLAVLGNCIVRSHSFMSNISWARGPGLHHRPLECSNLIGQLQG